MDEQSNSGNLPLFNLLPEKTNQITKPFSSFRLINNVFFPVIKAHKRMLAWLNRN